VWRRGRSEGKERKGKERKGTKRDGRRMSEVKCVFWHLIRQGKAGWVWGWEFFWDGTEGWRGVTCFSYTFVPP